MRLSNFLKAVSLVLTTSIVLSIAGATRTVAAEGISLSGSSYAQRYEDIEGVWDDSSATLTLKGNTSENKEYRPIEAITVSLKNPTGIEGSLKYSVYVQSKGWQDYQTEGNEAGIRNKGLRIEGLRMELTGALASKYTVEYSVQLQKQDNSQGFVSDGAVAGSPSDSRMIEVIKIRIVSANQGSATNVNYRAHRESLGWGSKWAKNGGVSGAAGKAKQLDSIELNLTGNQYKGGISYRSKIQNTGWESSWSTNGMTSGTMGKRIEAVEIKLTGDVADHYDVYYRVCVQSFGWLDWVKNGAETGVADLSYKLEAIQVVLTATGSDAPGDLGGITSLDGLTKITPKTPLLPGAGLFKMGKNAKVSYAVKDANGWSAIKSDGQVLEVTGPITGVAVGVNVPNSNLDLAVDMPDFGDEKADTVDDYDAPFDMKKVDAGKRLEYLRIALYEGYYYCNDDYDEEEYYSYNYNPDYSIFYRVKTSKKGWMAWTKDGLRCGTDEIGNTISAIQIVVLPAGQTPDENLGGVKSDSDKSVLRMKDFPAPKLVTANNKFASWCLKQFPNNQKASDYLKQHKHPPKYIFYSIAATWPYKLGGKTKKKCDCTGFAVWVYKNYHKKKVAHNSHKMAFKGKTVSVKNVKPGDLLCECDTYHGDVFFYVGKDEYGHDVMLDGMTPKINGKISHVYPCLRYIDLEKWAAKSTNYIRRK